MKNSFARENRSRGRKCYTTAQRVVSMDLLDLLEAEDHKQSQKHWGDWTGRYHKKLPFARESRIQPSASGVSAALSR